LPNSYAAVARATHASPETTKRIHAQYTTQRLREAFDRFSVAPEAVVAPVTSTTLAWIIHHTVPERAHDL